MAQEHDYILSYNPYAWQQSYPSRWSDQAVMRLLEHIALLLQHGNPARIHACCGLLEAIKQQDYGLVRAWIVTHDYKVREALCYSMAPACSRAG